MISKEAALYPVKYVKRRPVLAYGVIMGFLFSALSNKPDSWEITSGLVSTTLLRDYLVEKANKDAWDGRTKRAYLEALGGGLASVVGRGLIGMGVGVALGGRMPLVGTIMGISSGGADLVQNIRTVRKITHQRIPGFPSIEAMLS